MTLCGPSDISISPCHILIIREILTLQNNSEFCSGTMARFPYPSWEDKNFTAVGKPTINVLKLLSYSSATVDYWCAIGNAQFTRLALAKKHRELVILLSSAKFGSTYEWTHHIPISAKFGVTDVQREDLLKAGKAKGYFSEEYWTRNVAEFDRKESLLLTFLEAVIDAGEVDEELWQKTSEVFSEREVVEIISVQVGTLSSQITAWDQSN